VRYQRIYSEASEHDQIYGVWGIASEPVIYDRKKILSKIQRENEMTDDSISELDHWMETNYGEYWTEIKIDLTPEPQPEPEPEPEQFADKIFRFN